MSDNYSDSSESQAKKTVEESSLNFSQAKETFVEPSFSQPQPKKTVEESNINRSSRNPFVRKDPLEGKTIGDNNRYLLQTLLGQGGMSKVYRALDTKFEDRIVAVKLMTNYSTASSHHLIKRFMAEVKAISRLKHPNIIQILDFGITPNQLPFNGFPFYVMEFFSGNTLQDLLNQNKSLSIDSTINIIRQVCAGLKEAHQKGIVHRDLKPDNIFLVPGGAFGEIVKIIDFGIAKNISSQQKNLTQLTQAGSFIGTYRYASPEQCRGLTDIDHRSDIYSLGVIFYEAICGNNPYNLDDDFSTTQGDWIACHIKVTPKPLSEQSNYENIDKKLENLVMKCLAKKPQDRFSTIEELQNNLAAVVPNITKLNKESINEKQIADEIESQKQYKSTTQVKQQPEPTIVENQTIEDTYIPSELEAQKKHLSWEMVAGITAILLGAVGTGSYLLFNPSQKVTDNTTNNLDSFVTTLENKYNQGNYQDCYQLAINNPNQNNILIENWLGKCGLAAAQAKAEANNYTDAIAIAYTIPNTVPNYQQIQDSINIWSENILNYANTIYKKQGKEEAIKITNKLPNISGVQTKVKNLIFQWEQTDQKYQNILNKAQQLLNEKAWFVAKEEVEKIPIDFVVWTEKAKPILEEAKEGINNYKLPTSRKNTNATTNKPTPKTTNAPPSKTVISCEGGSILNCN